MQSLTVCLTVISKQKTVNLKLIQVTAYMYVMEYGHMIY